MELTSAKLDSEIDEDGFEGSLGSMEADNEHFARDENYLMEIQDHGTAEARKGRTLNIKKLEGDDSVNNHLDDVKEACSATEGHLSAFREKLEFEVMAGKIARSSSHVSRKKSKKVLFTRGV